MHAGGDPNQYISSAGYTGVYFKTLNDFNIDKGNNTQVLCNAFPSKLDWTPNTYGIRCVRMHDGGHYTTAAVSCS
jgi:hypothetical protein